LFDDDQMGVRLKVDGLDTQKFFTVSRLRDFGLIEYNGFIWLSRDEPSSSRYAIGVATIKSNESFELGVFNDDTSDHNIISYWVGYAKVIKAPDLTTYDLLKGSYELLKLMTTPPAPPVPPPKLKTPRFIPTRKRDVVEG